MYVGINLAEDVLLLIVIACFIVHVWRQAREKRRPEVRGFEVVKKNEQRSE